MSTPFHLAPTVRLVAIAAAFSLLNASSPAAPAPPSAPQVEEMVRAEFQHQVTEIPRAPRTFAKTDNVKVPENFAPWWIRGQQGAIGNTGSQRLSLEEFYVRALRNSKQVRVFSDLPLIRETGIQEAKGAFDTNTFLKTKFDHRNEPVGNTLTTGGSNRFKQDEWSFEAGAKKKFITGTEVSVSQQAGRTENNSTYFTPNPQSTSQLALTITQPLLKGAGVSYNRSIIQIARIDSDIAMKEFIRQSESHLLEIARTYWALYAARVTYLQKSRLVEETSRVSEELRGRRQVDAGQSQLFRAESALAVRRSDLVRSEAAVRNAQDRLRALTSDPELLAKADVELVPSDRLMLSSRAVDVQNSAQTALQNRPEINQAFLQLRAAGIRENVARNEILPELNLVLTGALGGLTDSDAGDAYSRQYSTGGPGYGAGFVFSFPLENNIGRARLERRRLELRQQLDQVKTTIDTVLLEVKVSAREVTTAYRETQAKYEAVRAFTEDIENITARRSLLTSSADSAQGTALYLDQLLDAQDRRSVAEEEFIRAAANYQIAIVNLERSKGNLLTFEDVTIVRGKDDRGLPQIHLEKGARDGKSTR